MQPEAEPVFSLVPAAYVILLREAPSPGAGAGQQGAVPARPAGAQGTQVLLQLRQGTGYMDGHWACGAAGHVEPGESALEAAVRETREETGAVVACADLEPLTVVHRSNDAGGSALEQRVDFFFTVRGWTGQPRVREASRSAALEWFALARLPSPVPPHELYVLRLLAEAVDGGAPVPAVTTFGFAPGEAVARYGTARPH